MPVARGLQINARSAVLVGLSGIIVALLVGALVLWAASSGGDVEVRLGDTDFNAGKIGRISAEIDDRGPVLYQDVGSGGSRDIIVQHLGDDPEVGWLAFAARRAGDPRDCFFTWDTVGREFFLTSASDAGCEATTVDEAGTGLQQYPVEVVDGDVRIDLNFESSNEDPVEDEP